MAIRVAVKPFTEIAITMSQMCDVITGGREIGECFEQRLIAIAGLIKVCLIQHQSRFQITTSIILNDEGDGYVFGGAGLSSATI